MLCVRGIGEIRCFRENRKIFGVSAERGEVVRNRAGSLQWWRLGTQPILLQKLGKHINHPLP